MFQVFQLVPEDVNHVEEQVHLVPPQLLPQDVHHVDEDDPLLLECTDEAINTAFLDIFPSLEDSEMSHDVCHILDGPPDEQDLVPLQADTQDVHLPPTETPDGPRRSRRTARRKFDNLCEENLPNFRF